MLRYRHKGRLAGERSPDRAPQPLTRVALPCYLGRKPKINQSGGMMSQSKGFRLIVVALLGFAFFAAQAATITVTSVADSVTPNDGAVTLREAITAVMAGNDLGDPNITAQGPFTGANAFGTADTINFNIAGAGVHTLAPASTYPNITKPVTIDGYSQPGAVANTLAVGDNAVLLIEINAQYSGLSSISRNER